MGSNPGYLFKIFSTLLRKIEAKLALIVTILELTLVFFWQLFIHHRSCKLGVTKFGGECRAGTAVAVSDETIQRSILEAVRPFKMVTR